LESRQHEKMDTKFQRMLKRYALIESTMYFLLCVHPNGSFYQKFQNRDNPEFHYFLWDLFTKYHELVLYTDKLKAKNIQ
jgi:hypothetical protein